MNSFSKTGAGRKILVLVLCFACLRSLEGRSIIVKLATLAPEGSPWHELLMEMGQEWRKATDGEVVLRIYPGGVAGDERDVIRKIRIGQIHAAAVTIEGLTDISRDMNVFYIPLLFENLSQLDEIRGELHPYLMKELENNGFKVLSWADVGWAYWFTREPIWTPSDLRKIRLFTWAGDYYTAELWKKAGFHPVPLASEHVLPSLQTGLIDAFATAPIVALSKQWFGPAPHMLDLKWGPLIGAIIISKRVWESIPEKHQKVLIQIGRETEHRAREQVPGSEESIKAMQDYGLEVHRLNPEQKSEWLEFIRDFYPRIRGTLVPTDIFDRAIRLKQRGDTHDEKDE